MSECKHLGAEPGKYCYECEIDYLKSENRKLRECVKVYADKDHWDRNSRGNRADFLNEVEGWGIAVDALKRIEKRNL